MARKRPRGKPFEPGNRANPLGAGAHNPDLKRVRHLTQEAVADMGAMILEQNLDALRAIKDDPTAPVLKVWFAAIAVRAISKGDATALGPVLDRIVGRVKEKVEVTTPGGGSSAKIIVFETVTINGTKD